MSLLSDIGIDKTKILFRLRFCHLKNNSKNGKLRYLIEYVIGIAMSNKHLDYLSLSLSLYIYIYIYIYMCVCVCV